MAEHKIEFEPGEVIRPEYSPENDLVALYVTDEGLESLRESVIPEGMGEERPADAEEPPFEGAIPLDSTALDIGMAVIEINSYVPEDIRGD